MWGEEWIDKVDQSAQQNKSVLFFSMVLLAIVAFLVVGYLDLKERLTVVVELPKVISASGKVTMTAAGQTNDKYFEVWAREIIRLGGSYTYKNVDEKYIQIERMLSPEVFEKYAQDFIRFRQSVIDNSVSVEFAPTGFTLTLNDEQNGAQVVVDGTYQKSIGGTIEKAGVCKYSFELKVIEGTLYVSSFSSNCN
jgi:hypothetical protein